MISDSQNVLALETVPWTLIHRSPTMLYKYCTGTISGLLSFLPRMSINQYAYGYSNNTLCLKKTSPTFLAITRESIDGFL